MTVAAVDYVVVGATTHTPLGRREANRREHRVGNIPRQKLPTPRLSIIRLRIRRSATDRRIFWRTFLSEKVTTAMAVNDIVAWHRRESKPRLEAG